MDVLVNKFDTPLCAASRPEVLKVRSSSARAVMPLALALPVSSWIALALVWPVHSDTFALLFVLSHALSLGLALFCFSRAWVYGERRLAAVSTLAIVVAAAPIATIVSALRFAC